MINKFTSLRLLSQPHQFQLMQFFNYDCNKWKDPKKHIPLTNTLLRLQYKNGLYFGMVNSLNEKQGKGIIAHDNGSLTIAHFISGYISGFFMHYQICTEEPSCSYCIYGYIDERSRRNECYLYEREQQKIYSIQILERVEKSQWKYNLKIERSEDEQKQEIYYISKDSKYKIKRTSALSVNQQNSGGIIQPCEFLYTYLSNTDQARIQNKKSQQTLSDLQIYQITKGQFYYGVLQKGKPNGFGIILVNHWPLCYGDFLDGKLSGLGRVQNRAMVLDGFFHDNLLTQGWVYNLNQQTTSTGTLIRRENLENDKKEKVSIFQLTQQLKGVIKQKGEKNRRKFHIKSLNFENEFIGGFEELINLQSLGQFRSWHKDKKQRMFSSFSKQSIYQINVIEQMSQISLDSDQKEQFAKDENRSIKIQIQKYFPQFISEIPKAEDNKSMSMAMDMGMKAENKRQQQSLVSHVQKDLIDLINQYSNLKMSEKSSSIRRSQQKEKKEHGKQLQTPNLKSKSYYYSLLSMNHGNEPYGRQKADKLRTEKEKEGEKDKKQKIQIGIGIGIGEKKQKNEKLQTLEQSQIKLEENSVKQNNEKEKPSVMQKKKQKQKMGSQPSRLHLDRIYSKFLKKI